MRATPATEPTTAPAMAPPLIPDELDPESESGFEMAAVDAALAEPDAIASVGALVLVEELCCMCQRDVIRGSGNSMTYTTGTSGLVPFDEMGIRLIARCERENVVAGVTTFIKSADSHGYARLQITPTTASVRWPVCVDGCLWCDKLKSPISGQIVSKAVLSIFVGGSLRSHLTL